jgi:dihydrofolate synthase/folylpolyglutamate synthase
MSFQRYHEGVDYLERRLWRELPIVPVERALQGRIRTLLAHFGDPHRAMPVIHVGGSAGKGSTATMIASLLRAAGLRTGLYTSPHLQTFIERIDVNGALIAPERFAGLVLGLDPLVRKMHIDVLDGEGFGRPSLVEVAFAAGMRHFADERCDVAVIEVGLGGRTDCTNVFEQPAVTVVTNVELEHRERLGPTIEAIAREKADIIKGGIVITGATRRDALNVIEARCREQGATLWRLGEEIAVRVREAGEHRSRIDVRTPRGTLRDVTVGAPGAHQARNAAVAIAAAQAYDMRLAADETALRMGIDSVRLRGRLETVQESPRVILDAAHNPAEARALAAALPAHVADGRELHLLVGILADKDQASMVRALAPIASSVVVTQPPLGERTGDPRRMLEGFARIVGERNVLFEPAPERALDIALDRASDDDVMCVTGSMFLVGALRNRWVPEERILSRRTAALAADERAPGLR